MNKIKKAITWILTIILWAAVLWYSKYCLVEMNGTLSLKTFIISLIIAAAVLLVLLLLHVFKAERQGKKVKTVNNFTKKEIAENFKIDEAVVIDMQTQSYIVLPDTIV